MIKKTSFVILFLLCFVVFLSKFEAAVVTNTKCRYFDLSGYRTVTILIDHNNRIACSNSPDNKFGIDGCSVNASDLYDSSTSQYDCKKQRKIYLENVSSFSHRDTSNPFFRVSYLDSVFSDVLYLKEIEVVEEEYGTPGTEIDCESIFSGNFGGIIKEIENFVKILVPGIVVVLSSIDLIKAIASQDTDKSKSAGIKFLKRLGIAILIFVVTGLIYYILSFIDVQRCL